MNKRPTRWLSSWVMLTMLAAFAWSLSATPAATAPPVVGDWQGALSAGGSSLRMVLHVTQDADGKLSGTMDSPDQGATGIPLSSISFKSPDLHFEIQRIGGSYDGKINKDNTEIAGDWKQGGGSFPLTLKRAAK